MKSNDVKKIAEIDARDAGRGAGAAIDLAPEASERTTRYVDGHRQALFLSNVASVEKY